jgi:hypothetical protein
MFFNKCKSASAKKLEVYFMSRAEAGNRILQSPVSDNAPRIEPYPTLEKMSGLEYEVRII